MPADPPNSLIYSVFSALATAGPLQCEHLEPPVFYIDRLELSIFWNNANCKILLNVIACPAMDHALWLIFTNKAFYVAFGSHSIM